MTGPRILVEWWATFWASALSIWAAVGAGKYWDSIVDKENGIIKGRSTRPGGPGRSTTVHERMN
jgi:hypothetical protein